MSCHRLGPQLAGAQRAAYIAPELQRRVQAFCRVVGFTRAVGLLKVGQITLESARDGGRLRPDTIARIMEGLDREEPEARLEEDGVSASREEMLACVEREIKMRERVYPEWVKLGKMSAQKAERELATMRNVRAVIAALPVEPPAQTALFGGARS